MALREFVTAVQRSDENPDGEPLVFMLDGQEMRAYKPTEGQYALLVMALGRHARDLDKFAGMIDFFIQVLDEPSEQYVVERMMSRENIIPLTTIVGILEWMVEEWGGRPFPSPSDSTSSQPKGGKKSTRRSPALT